jgi:hypothetical protein
LGLGFISKFKKFAASKKKVLAFAAAFLCTLVVEIFGSNKKHVSSKHLKK